nr:hypothetical protein [Gordonia soli]
MPFSDDELEEFYRRIEARTAAQVGRRVPRHRRPLLACPTPDKEAYRDEESARSGVYRIRERSRGDLRLRIYHCACGSWHITSSPDLWFRR